MTHPLTNALAMRTAAAEISAEYMEWADNWGEYKNQKACDTCSAEIATAILALPLEADHAALLREALTLPEIAGLIDALTEIAAKDDAGDYLYHAPGPYARIAKSALSALETP